jgi:hypothetical protein
VSNPVLLGGKTMARKLSPSSSLSGAFVLPLLVVLSPTLGCSSETTDPEPTGGVDKLVYAVRQHTVATDQGVSIDVAGGMGQVMDYNRYNPGGTIEIHDTRTATTENMLAGYPFEQTSDVSSLHVSYDATKVVFTMKTNNDDSYHVYWSALEKGPSGNFEIHQLTFGPNDDEHAIWIAGDRIAFITNQAYTEMGTRADEYNHSRVVTQLATITLAGGDADRKLCSQNLSHTINLFPLADGRVGFSRWEHLENTNDVKLFAMHPDCTQMFALYGQHGKPGNSVVQVSETRTPNVLLGIVTDRENTIQAGSLVSIDVRSDLDPLHADEEQPEVDVLTPAVPRGMEPSPVGRYRTPQSLPDGRILTSWAKGSVNDLNEMSLTPPDFGIYIYNPSTRQNELVVNHENSWELYAQPIAARTAPPIISSIQDSADATMPAIFGSVDVRQTSLFSVHGQRVSGAQFDEEPIDSALKQAVKVRVIEGFSSEGSPGNTMFGLTMAEGAALLGEAKVHSDGSWRAHVPPYVPVHMQAVDRFDLAIRSELLWIQAMPGEDRVCGGCHESRTAPSLPGGQQLTLAAGLPPENFMMPVASRTEYPWDGANDSGNVNEIQKILDARCSSCHNESRNGAVAQTFYTVTMPGENGAAPTVTQIPRLDLSSRMITVTYDNETKPWPASYVSLFYPAALAMEMDEAEVTGIKPLEWAIPSDARKSVLIEKLNIAASNNPNEYAWALGQPFSETTVQGGTRTDHGAQVGLTREELVKLIRAIDMGGQYYARQNSAFVPNGTDPVSGSGPKY